MIDLETNRMHLQKIKRADVDWVRMDVFEPIEECASLFRVAHELDIKVIAIVKSKTLLKGLGLGTRMYLRSSKWGSKWKRRMVEVASKLEPYVEIWQIDNELNHFWHNFIPSMNSELATDIVDLGADAVREVDPEAKLAANLFYRVGLPIPGLSIIRYEPFILRYKERLRDKIDILGLDIYRPTWHRGTPADYPNDLEHFHDLWEGDVMILETGYCTGLFRGSEADQADHVREVFRHLEDYVLNVPWFAGIVWYVFKSSHSGLPCENFFGLHKHEGFEEKPAWGEFVDQVRQCGESGKILSITYQG